MGAQWSIRIRRFSAELSFLEDSVGRRRNYNVTTTPGETARNSIKAGDKSAGHRHFWSTMMNGERHQNLLIIPRSWVRSPPAPPVQASVIRRHGEPGEVGGARVTLRGSSHLRSTPTGPRRGAGSPPLASKPAGTSDPGRTRSQRRGGRRLLLPRRGTEVVINCDAQSSATKSRCRPIWQR